MAVVLAFDASPFTEADHLAVLALCDRMRATGRWSHVRLAKGDGFESYLVFASREARWASWLFTRHSTGQYTLEDREGRLFARGRTAAAVLSCLASVVARGSP